MVGCKFGKILPIIVPKCHGGKTFDKKLPTSSEFYYLEPGLYPSILEPGLYPSIADTVEAMNTLIQGRHNHSENCIPVKVS